MVHLLNNGEWQMAGMGPHQTDKHKHKALQDVAVQL